MDSPIGCCLLLPAMKLRQGNVFTPVCQSFCSHWAMHPLLHTLPCHAYLPLSHTHPCHACPLPTAMHAPLPCTPPATHAPPGYYEMRSMSGRYASYWNALLFHKMNDNLSTFVSSSPVYSWYLSLDLSKRSGPHRSSGHSSVRKISVVFPSEIQAC